MNSTPVKLTNMVILFCAAGLASNASPGQDETSQSLQTRIESTNAALIELDQKASSCLSSFGMNLGEAAALLCDEFMRAVDGELMAGYIEDCKALKAWRDTFIESRSSLEQTNPDSSDAQQLLDQMIAVEYNCGDNALQNRTENVVAAFDTLNEGSLLNQTVGQSLNRKMAELEFQSRLDSQGQALQNAIQRQGQLSNQATQQQIRRLENELIRQQINQP